MPETPEASGARLPLVFDNTVLSNFAAVDRISLLEQLYRGRAYTTLMVVDEIQDGLQAGYQYLQSVEEVLSAPHPAGWLQVLSLDSAEEQALYIELTASLSAGEASCLAVAIARGFVFATDDLAARRAATQRNVRLTGTIGILIRLVREGHLPLSEANNILAQMIALRYRAPVERLDDLV
jgi:predicted nucleic acid-binding protein